jgi:hypothetical protein
MRTVPECERITKLCVIAPPAWKPTPKTGAEGVNTVKQLGKDTRGQAQALKGKLAGKIADRLPRKEIESEK